jgi:hypothetical protein
MVMMFVDLTINGLDVQGPMENGIEKVKDNKEYRQREDNCTKRQVFHLPQSVCFIKAISEQQVDERTSLCLADTNVQVIGGTELVQMLPSDRNACRLHPY